MVLGLVLGACASAPDLARDRASREFDCPSNKIHVTWLHGEIYRVRGCGRQSNYECDEITEICRAEEGSIEAPK